MLDLKRNFKELEHGLKNGYVTRGSTNNLATYMQGSTGELLKSASKKTRISIEDSKNITA